MRDVIKKEAAGVYTLDGVLVIDFKNPQNRGFCRDVTISFGELAITVSGLRVNRQHHFPMPFEIGGGDRLNPDEVLEQYVRVVKKKKPRGFWDSWLKPVEYIEVKEVIPGFCEMKDTNKPFSITTNLYRIVWADFQFKNQNKQS